MMHMLQLINLAILTLMSQVKMASGITNIAIDQILSSCGTFYGTFSADSIPRELATRTRFSIICNLSKINEVGTHFVTIIVYEKCVLYIDSFGLPCFNSNIKEF